MLTNGTYRNEGHCQYLLHPNYASEPQHYIRAFRIILKDLKELFEYVEPCDQNKETVSLIIQELLTRVCIEIEANFTAILKENLYSRKGNWNMQNDYCLVDYTHKLSFYQVKFPIWKGANDVRQPFKNWSDKSDKNWHVLDWYQAYNKSKHDRHSYFQKATFDNLLNAVSGMVVLLSAQFMNENYSPAPKSLSIGYSYDFDPKFDIAIGGDFKVKYPEFQHWNSNELYGFKWDNIESDPNPIDLIDYDKIKKGIITL